MIRAASIAFGLVLAASLTAAAAPGDSTGVLQIAAGSVQLNVYDGGRFLGTTPIESARVDTGFHTLRYSPARAGGWSPAMGAETVYVGPGEVVHRMFDVQVPCRITSQPSGAAIYARDSVIGVTPAIVIVPRNVSMLKFSRSGYDDASLPYMTGASELRAVLSPRGGLLPDPAQALAPPSGHNNIGLYASAGVTIVAGAAAAAWKIRADRMYDDYRLTGNEGSLDRMRGYDQASGISLLVSQIGISVFTYLLLTR